MITTNEQIVIWIFQEICFLATMAITILVAYFVHEITMGEGDKLKDD